MQATGDVKSGWITDTVECRVFFWKHLVSQRMDNSYQINKFQQIHNQNRAECNSIVKDGVQEGVLSPLLNTHEKA